MKSLKKKQSKTKEHNLLQENSTYQKYLYKKLLVLNTFSSITPSLKVYRIKQYFCSQIQFEPGSLDEKTSTSTIIQQHFKRSHRFSLMIRSIKSDLKNLIKYKNYLGRCKNLYQLQFQSNIPGNCELTIKKLFQSTKLIKLEKIRINLNSRSNYSLIPRSIMPLRNLSSLEFSTFGQFSGDFIQWTGMKNTKAYLTELPLKKEQIHELKLLINKFYRFEICPFLLKLPQLQSVSLISMQQNENQTILEVLRSAKYFLSLNELALMFQGLFKSKFLYDIMQLISDFPSLTSLTIKTEIHNEERIQESFKEISDKFQSKLRSLSLDLGPNIVFKPSNNPFFSKLSCINFLSKLRLQLSLHHFGKRNEFMSLCSFIKGQYSLRSLAINFCRKNPTNGDWVQLFQNCLSKLKNLDSLTIGYSEIRENSVIIPDHLSEFLKESKSLKSLDISYIYFSSKQEQDKFTQMIKKSQVRSLTLMVSSLFIEQYDILASFLESFYLKMSNKQCKNKLFRELLEQLQVKNGSRGSLFRIEKVINF